MTTINEQRVFDHVIVIMLENQYVGDVMQNDDMRGIANQGILLGNSYGVMHPSQTNYIASISGQLCGVNNDNPLNPLLSQTNLLHLIEQSSCGQLSWQAYMEGYDLYQSKLAQYQPSVSAFLRGQSELEEAAMKKYTASLDTSEGYVPRHDPFSSFANTQDSDNIVDLSRLNCDLAAGQLANYVWVSPNVWHDGHFIQGQYSGATPYNAADLIAQSARFLKSMFFQWNLFGDNPDSTTQLPPNTLVVVTYDEALFDESYVDNVVEGRLADSPNQIYTVLLGDVITQQMKQQVPSAINNESFNHYSLLKTVELNFALGDLATNDKEANWYQFLWGKQFHWQQSLLCHKVERFQALAATGWQKQLLLVGVGDLGQLLYCCGRPETLDVAQSMQPIPDTVPACAQICVCRYDDSCYLAYLNTDGQLAICRYDAAEQLWRNIDSPVLSGDIKQIELITVEHQRSMMLVSLHQDGQLSSCVMTNEVWQVPVKLVPAPNSVQHISLAALGGNILLIYTDDENYLNCYTYNSAHYNRIATNLANTANIPFVNAYSLNAWSKETFALKHYDLDLDNYTDYAPEPSRYQATGLLCNATLQGNLFLFNNSDGRFYCESLSLNGLLTSSEVTQPVTVDNQILGYGTMLEASWNGQSIDQIVRDDCAPMAAACVSTAVWLVYQQGQQLKLLCGEYR